jgi:signal transduction histidine kinase
VFLNLIKNAWEALKSTVEPHIEIKISEAGSQDLIVQVRDNGPGIPPEILDKIWVSFFTTKGGQGGTGLGLAACTQIISQSGGKIWVESEVGAGATFFVQLPLATTKSADHQNMPEEIKT